jgi:hypothetical protein
MEKSVREARLKVLVIIYSIVQHGFLGSTGLRHSATVAPQSKSQVDVNVNLTVEARLCR